MEYHGFTVFLVFSIILGVFVQAQLPDCCLNDLCPYYCVRCDGTAQCFDLSDELGCSSESDKKLNSYSKPPIFVPFVLKTITSQLRKEKEAVASRFPNRDCLTPPGLQSKRRNTYRTDTNEPEEREEGWSLRVMKFRNTPTTTEAPIWLQLLRKLQAEKERPPTTTTTTTTTTTPAPTTTTDPPWLTLLKNLLQVVKANSTTTQAAVVTTEQQTKYAPTQPVYDTTTLSITPPPTTDTSYIDTTTTPPPDTTTASLPDTTTIIPTTSAPTSTSVINITSTRYSTSSIPSDPLSTSARIISYLTKEKISTTIPFIVTQSSKTPDIEQTFTTDVVGLTTELTSENKTVYNVSNNITASEITTRILDMSSSPRTELSKEMSTAIEQFRTILSKDINDTNDNDSVTNATSIEVSHDSTKPTFTDMSTVNVTGVPIDFDLISTISSYTKDNNTDHLPSISSTVESITSTLSNVTEVVTINETEEPQSLNETLSTLFMNRTHQTTTVNITDDAIMNVTGIPVEITTSDASLPHQEIVNPSTVGVTDTTFLTSTDAPSIQSNIMKMIDKLLSKINETEAEISNSSAVTPRFPMELKHFYTNETFNETEISTVSGLNDSSSGLTATSKYSPRIGLIEIGEVTSKDIMDNIREITTTLNGIIQNNTSNKDIYNVSRPSNMDLNATTSSIEQITSEVFTTQPVFTARADSNVVVDTTVSSNFDKTTGQISEDTNNKIGLATVSNTGNTITTTESEVDILLKEVRKTLNETKSRISSLASQINAMNVTSTNATYDIFNDTESVRPRLFKYGLLSDSQTEVGNTNFTANDTVRVRPILQESNHGDTVKQTINDQQSGSFNKPAEITPIPWLLQTTSFPFDNFWDTITTQPPMLDSIFNPLPPNTIWSSLFDTWGLGTIGVPTTPRQQNFDSPPTTTPKQQRVVNSTPATTPSQEIFVTGLPISTDQQLFDRQTTTGTQTFETQPTTSRQQTFDADKPTTGRQQTFVTQPTTGQQLINIQQTTSQQTFDSQSTTRQQEFVTQPATRQRILNIDPTTSREQMPETALPTTTGQQTFDTARSTAPQEQTFNTQTTTTQAPETVTTDQPVQATDPTTTTSPVTYLQTEPPLANGIQIPVIRTQDTTSNTGVNKTETISTGPTGGEIYYVLKQGTTLGPDPAVPVSDPSRNIEVAFITEPGVNFDNDTNNNINTTFTVSNIPIVTPNTYRYDDSRENTKQIHASGNIAIVSAPEVTANVLKDASSYPTASNVNYVIKQTTVMPETTTPSVPTPAKSKYVTTTGSFLRNKSERKAHDKSHQDWWDQAFQPTTWFPFETQYPTNTPIPWNTADKQLLDSVDPVQTTTVANGKGCMLLQDASAFCKDLHSGQYKNPDDCTTYFVCDWGDLYRCHCPPNTLFDGKLRVCNWDYAVTC